MLGLGFRAACLILALGSLAGCGLGCGQKLALDRGADDGVAALRKSDYPGFLAITHPDMQRALPRPEFEKMAEAVQRLGAYRGCTMKGVFFMAYPVMGTRGTYELDFAQGRVDLELFVVRGKIRRFYLAGSAIESALEEVKEAARVAAFTITSFRFLAGAAPSLAPADPVLFTLAAEGLAVEDGATEVGCDVRFLDGAGQVAFAVEKVCVDGTAASEEADDGGDSVAGRNSGIQSRVLVNQGAKAGAVSLTGLILPPRVPLEAGSYRLEVKLTDANADRTVTATQPFTIRSR
ncbi:MAG TPA: hypothetical protein VGQ83_14035 [Polyangia bacterium]|jgi:hypothetical protein